MHLNPWLQDGLALVLTVIAIQALVLVNGVLQKKSLLPTYITRKIIHIFAAPIFVLCWMLYSGAPASRFFAAMVPLAFIIQFGAIGLGWYQDEAFVKSMSRSGDPRELLGGTMHYAVVMLVAVLAFFTTGSPGKAFAPAAMLILGSLAGGDGLADIIGRRYGGKSFGIGGSTKTLAGSLAMFVGSFAMSWLLLAAFGWRSGQGSAALVMPALALSLLATVVEAFSPQGFDNYTIPLAVLAGAWGMGLL
jgi:dolichol kinase